jgi:glycosyltransferase A (GT-A) superfamily protein (DUF2064 family)
VSVPATVLVIAKEPVPGRVKTRLSPPYSPGEAAALAAAALADTLELVAATPVRRRILCLQGSPGPWLPPGFEVRPQAEGTLDVRIAAALAAVDGPVLLLGMDTPQLLAADLDLPGLISTDAENSTDAGNGPRQAWLGPAEDGGFWALGLTHPDPALVLGVPMSRPDTGARQRQRLQDAGLPVTLLRTLRDVDTAPDVARVAALAPTGRFAAVAAGLPARPTPTATR